MHDHLWSSESASALPMGRIFRIETSLFDLSIKPRNNDVLNLGKGDWII